MMRLNRVDENNIGQIREFIGILGKDVLEDFDILYSKGNSTELERLHNLNNYEEKRLRKCLKNYE